MPLGTLEGEIVTRRHADGRVEIVSAPPVARMSLEILRDCDPAVLRVTGREIHLAGKVSYRVTGWDELSAALMLARVEGDV